MAWQVYGIISAQLVLTAIVSGTILAVPPVRGFVTTSLWFQITCAVLPLVGAHTFLIQTQIAAAPRSLSDHAIVILVLSGLYLNME